MVPITPGTNRKTVLPPWRKEQRPQRASDQKLTAERSGLADLWPFMSQSLSIFILFSQLSMNPAKVLLNFPLLSMKKHLTFVGILTVRTKSLLATGVPANRVEPADRDRLPTETVEILICLL